MSIMMPCKEVVRILSSSEELSLLKRMELKMHLMMCTHCAQYSKQLDLIHDGFQKLFKHKLTVDPEAVAKIEEKVIKTFRDPPTQ